MTTIKITIAILLSKQLVSAFAFIPVGTKPTTIPPLPPLLSNAPFSQHANFIARPSRSHSLFSTTTETTTIPPTTTGKETEKTTSSYPPPPPNSPYSPTEWYQRCSLAVSYRIACMEDWDLVIFNHITLKVENSENEKDGPHFLINDFGMGFDEVTASSLLKITLSGKQILPEEKKECKKKGRVFSAGYVLHSAIHETRHDVSAIWHCHSLDATALSQTQFKLLPLGQEAAFVLGKGIGYHPFEGTANDVSEQPRIVSNLGPENKVLWLENHGPLVACTTIEEAYAIMYFLTRAASYQMRALAAVGGDLEKMNMPCEEIVDQMLLRIDKLGDVPGAGGNQKEKEEEEEEEDKYDIETLMFEYAKRAAERKYGAHDIYR